MTEMATKGLLGGTDSLDKGVLLGPGGMEQERTRFAHATQNRMQF